MQCFGSALILVGWIRLRIQEGKNDPKKLGKREDSSAGCSLLRAEGFSCGLDVLCGGLVISKLEFLIKNI
jgi:hypothetical protein